MSDEDSDESLSEAFWGVARAFRHLSKDASEPWDVTPSQARALGVLMHHGVMRLSELSDHLRIAPRSTTEVVDALEERGLIERQPDPNDRRATLVKLTESGTSTGTAIQAARKAQAQSFFAVLTEAEQHQLAELLHKLRPA